MKRILILTLCALLFGACASPEQRLVIIHVNDTHSHLDPERSGEYEGRGGVIERAAYIDSVRQAVGEENVLLLHAGDWDQGTSYYNVLNGDLEIDLMNALGYDCVTFGNHEFDNNIEDLQRRVARLEVPVACANYDFSPFELGKYVHPYVIVRKAGYKIGIVGMLPDITKVVDRSVSDRLPHLDDVEMLGKWSDYLKNEEKCDLVILLSHMGYREDMDIVSKVTNVDLVIGGHSHTYLKDISYAEDKSGRPVPVVQDWKWGLELGQIEVY